MQSFGTSGYKWVRYRGSHALGDPAAFVTGLIRLPADTPLGDDWICPGADSVYVATSTREMSDCTDISNRCEFALIMRNPTRRLVLPVARVRSTCR